MSWKNSRLVIDKIRDNVLKNFVVFILKKHEEAYFFAPGSIANHHAYIGGLAEHSISAANLGCQIAQHYNSIGISVNRDMVIAGTLLHDIGKIRAYKWSDERTDENGEHIGGGFIYNTPECSMIHHIPLGYGIVLEAIREFNSSRKLKEHIMDNKKSQKLLHIILSHHGRKSWGSPVIPQTIEAYIVHCVEMMDSYVDKFNSGKVPRSFYD